MRGAILSVTEHIIHMDTECMEFYADSHSYINTDTEEEYNSVTQILSEYVRPFNPEFIAPKVAEKNNIPVDIVLNDWRNKGEYGALRGNIIHNAIESWFYKYDIFIPEFLQEEVELTKQWIREQKFKSVYPEFQVADHDNLISGTIDLITVNEDGSLNLYDWKTNDLYKKNKGRLLPPLKHLKNDKMTLYTLQLSLYRYILEKEGNKVNKCSLVNIFDGSVNEIELDYLKEDIEIILKGM